MSLISALPKEAFILNHPQGISQQLSAQPETHRICPSPPPEKLTLRPQSSTVFPPKDVILCPVGYLCFSTR